MQTRFGHLSLAILAATILAIPGQAQQEDITGPATFVVLSHGSRVGSQSVSLTRTPNGWLLSSTGRLDPPFSLVTNKFELTYSTDWQPQRLDIEAALRGQTLTMSSSFGLTTATNEVLQGAQRASNAQQLSPRAVVLPTNFFGAYEGLAARLAGAVAGTRLPVYVVPVGEGSASVNRTTSRRVTTPNGPIDIREFLVTIQSGGETTPVELWTDSRNRLARLVLPTASFVMLRDDLASVMSREERIRVAGDDEAFIPANGFQLGATFTKPTNTPARAPVVILASSPGPQGRDSTVYGIPIFGELASILSKAGYFVVRYDSRGMGQSGGRTESSGLAEYAEDVVQVVSWLRKRKDVDADRIAVIGYGEGGPVALTAAAREGRIKGVALVAAPGRTGREVTIEQQQRVLARLNIPEQDKVARRRLQARVIDAALTGKWEGINPEVRAQADSPWFRTWLAFDPAVVMKKIKQPVLIVAGALDREIPAEHADRLDELSRTRSKVPVTHTRKVIVPELNHLLVPATTGEIDEYPLVGDRTVSPAVGEALTTWLPTVLNTR